MFSLIATLRRDIMSSGSDRMLRTLSTVDLGALVKGMDNVGNFRKTMIDTKWREEGDSRSFCSA